MCATPRCSRVLVPPQHVAAMALAVTTDTVPCVIVAGELTVDAALTFSELPPVCSLCGAAVVLQTAALTAHWSPVPQRAAGARPASRPRSLWRSWAQERSSRACGERPSMGGYTATMARGTVTALLLLRILLALDAINHVIRSDDLCGRRGPYR